MRLKENELKVFYHGKLNEKLDEDIGDLLKTHGYQCWASGFDLEDCIRDLAFDKKSNEKLINETTLLTYESGK